MGIMGVIQFLGWRAFANPHCDSLQEQLSKLEDNLETLEELNADDQKLFAEEEATWKKLAKMQDAIISQAEILEQSRERVDQTVVNSSRRKQVAEVAKRFQSLPEINSSEVEEELVLLRESLKALHDAEAKLRAQLLSSKKLQVKR